MTSSGGTDVAKALRGRWAVAISALRKAVGETKVDQASLAKVIERRYDEMKSTAATGITATGLIITLATFFGRDGKWEVLLVMIVLAALTAYLSLIALGRAGQLSDLLDEIALADSSMPRSGLWRWIPGIGSRKRDE